MDECIEFLNDPTHDPKDKKLISSTRYVSLYQTCQLRGLKLSKSTFEVLPISDIHNFKVGQIQQRSSEDRYVCCQIGPFSMYAVFDGHGKSHGMSPEHVGDYLVKMLPQRLAENLGQINYEIPIYVVNCIRKTFINIDTEMYLNQLKHGSTCSGVLLDRQRKMLYVFNLGDSRTTLYDDMLNIIFETSDHKPSDVSETKHIQTQGGTIENYRVNGILAVSRAFGDYMLKSSATGILSSSSGIVRANPDCTIINLATGTIITESMTRSFNPNLNLHLFITSDAVYDHLDSNTVIKQYYDYQGNAMTTANYVSQYSDDDITIIFID